MARFLTAHIDGFVPTEYLEGPAAVFEAAFNILNPDVASALLRAELLNVRTLVQANKVALDAAREKLAAVRPTRDNQPTGEGWRARERLYLAEHALKVNSNRLEKLEALLQSTTDGGD